MQEDPTCYPLRVHLGEWAYQEDPLQVLTLQCHLPKEYAHLVHNSPSTLVITISIHVFIHCTFVVRSQVVYDNLGPGSHWKAYVVRDHGDQMFHKRTLKDYLEVLMDLMEDQGDNLLVGQTFSNCALMDPGAQMQLGMRDQDLRGLGGLMGNLSDLDLMVLQEDQKDSTYDMRDHNMGDQILMVLKRVLMEQLPDLRDKTMGHQTSKGGPMVNQKALKKIRVAMVNTLGLRDHQEEDQV